MLNRRATVQRLVQARSFGVPSLLANFSNLMSATSESMRPSVLVATGDVMDLIHNAVVDTYITWGSRPLISEALANIWAREQGATDPDQIMARAYGEMIAISDVRDRSSNDDRLRARAHIVRSLKSSPPPANDIRVVVNDIIRLCVTAIADIVDQDVSAPYVPEGVRVSQQTHMFYKHCGHIIPATLFANANAQEAWMQLSDLARNHVDLANLDFAFVADIQQIWTNMQEHSVLGFYEARATFNIEKTRGMMGGAIFCYLSTLARETNMTSAWIQRRKDQFQDRIPSIPLGNYINDAILKHYARMYVARAAEWNDVYRQMVASWNMLQVSEGLSLAWIIEQSSNNNVTALTTISDVVRKLRFFSYDYLVAKGVPEQNFVAAL